jgi:RNA polymerase sigma factor for flagellar operon FliA
MSAQLAIVPASTVTTDGRATTTQDLVHTHLPLIRTIATRLSKRLPPSVEVEELVNIGVIGLLDANDRFDSGKGVPFKSYAELRIKGQMIDALRADDLVPRSVRRKHNRIQQEQQVLRNRLGRKPTREELRNQLDLAPKKFDAYESDSFIAPIASLDASITDDGSATLAESLSNNDPTAEDSFAEGQMRKSVAEAIHCLPEKERFAVTEYYLRHRTLKSIGTELGVTESRACQLRSQGVKRLRFRLRGVAG